MERTSEIVWSNEIRESALWILKAWSLTILGMSSGIYALIRWTKWGRKLQLVGRSMVSGPKRWRIWFAAAMAVLMVQVDIRIALLASNVVNDQFTGLQEIVNGASSGDDTQLDAGTDLFWSSIILTLVFVVLTLASGFVAAYLSNWLNITCRQEMTENYIQHWVRSPGYGGNSRQSTTVDNPEQRIHEDIEGFLTQTYNFVLSSGSPAASVSRLVAFVPLLWTLSGPLTVAGVTVPRALFVVTVLYIVVSTVVVTYLGRKLPRINFDAQRASGDYRYSLTRARENSDSIASYDGQARETDDLKDSFIPVVKYNWRLFWHGQKVSVGQILLAQSANVVPLIVQVPRLISGGISLGDFTQSSTAFSSVNQAAGFLRDNVTTGAEYFAAINRLAGLREARHDDSSGASIIEDNRRTVRFESLTVRTPSGSEVVNDLTLELEPGDRLLIRGASGIGKTTFLRSIAGLWKGCQGTIAYPGTTRLFVPQKAYSPIGTLRDAILFPSMKGAADDDVILDALHAVKLSSYERRLDESADWMKVLSPGELQRLSLARVLLHRPEVIILDEATSAVDVKLEAHLYDALQRELPESILINASHGANADLHHNLRLDLIEGGKWTVSSPVETEYNDDAVTLPTASAGRKYD